MIRYSVLGSGSSGNSYVISYEGTSLLFDIGFSLKEIRYRLARTNVDIASVNALFITHFHPDHSRGAGVFARQTKKPVYVHQEIIEAKIPELLVLGIPEHLLCGFEPDSPVMIGPFEVAAFPTSHDSPHSLGYSISVNGREFLLLTDTGRTNNQMKEKAKKADVIFLESNYEAKMLEQGPYPRMLKKRIAGEQGHLSNHEAIQLLSASSDCNGRCRRVYLCHLSKVNNSPEVLLKRLQELPILDAEITVCHNSIQYLDEIS